MFPELATVFHPNEAEALLPSAHALEKKRKRQRKIMIAASTVCLSLGVCALTIGITLFFFISKDEASGSSSGISPDWASLPPEVASAINEYNAAVTGYNYDGRDKGKSENERPTAIVESWLPAHGALNWRMDNDDDDKVNFTLMKSAARTVVIGHGYDNFTKPSTSAMLVAEFQSAADSSPNASAIFIFNPLVVRNFGLDVPVASTSVEILRIACVPVGLKKDLAGVVTATNGHFILSPNAPASCSLEHMQQACKFEYNTESEFVPANASMETEPCPAGSTDCGACRVRTYLEDVCAVLVKAKGTPPYAPADGALRSCYYPFDGLDERSFKYVINPLFTGQQHQARSIQEEIEREASVESGDGARARGSWITTLSLRFSTDPFISLQRLTKGKMVFLTKDGNPYDPRGRRDDKGGTEESDRDDGACDQECNKTRRRIGSILIYLGTPLLVLGLLSLVVTLVKFTSKKEVAKY